MTILKENPTQFAARFTSELTGEPLLEAEKTARYTAGEIEYSTVGEMTGHNPVIVIPGFTEGRYVLRNFAHTLHNEGDRQVIYPEQPKIDKNAEDKLSIIDHHAEALLAVIEAEDLGSKPVDFISHSFGSLVLARAAELAKERGLNCFSNELGSHAILVAPAGSNEKENMATLGGRWVRFIYREANPAPIGNFTTKELDPSGEMLKAGQKNANADKLKTLKEVWVVNNKEKMYRRLGSAGIKPHILGFSNDVLMPHKNRASAVAKHGEIIAGYSVPIDSGGARVEAFSQKPDLEEFKQKTGLKGDEAKKAWTHHYVNEGHNDLLFHPLRSVKAILPILDGNALQVSKAADAEYLKTRS